MLQATICTLYLLHLPLNRNTMFSSISLYFRRLRLTQYTRVSSESDHEWPLIVKASPAGRFLGASSWPNALLTWFLCLLTAAGGFLLGLKGQHDKERLPAWGHSMPRGPLNILYL